MIYVRYPLSLRQFEDLLFTRGPPAAFYTRLGFLAETVFDIHNNRLEIPNIYPEFKMAESFEINSNAIFETLEDWERVLQAENINFAELSP